MNASPLISLKHLLSPLVVAAVLASPCAFAKKDLFATEPGANNAASAQHLVPASSTANEDSRADSDAQSEAPKTSDAAVYPVRTTSTDSKKEAAVNPSERPTTKSSTVQSDAPSAKEPSAIEVQFERLKRNLNKTKNDLFGNKESSEKKISPAIEPQLADSKALEDEPKSEVPTISATEAAQRAQTYAEGQVINVRKYHEEDKPRYAVKLLQKNGRMKTINLDAISGAQIEETPQ